MSNFRIMLLSTAAIGFAGALTTSAFAGEVEKTASFGGLVNRAIGMVDNGDATKILSADNGQSRVRFQGSATSESLTTKAYIEVRARGAKSASSNASAAAASDLSIRHSYVSLSNNMGSLVMGETNPSGDLNGVFSGQFSGSDGYGVNADQVNPFAADFYVQNAGNTSGPEETTLTSVAPTAGLSESRGGVIRYDTPDFNGFSASTGLKGGADAAEEWSASAGYSADFDGTKVAAGYGYTNKSGSSASQNAAHSVGAGFELASGINAQVGYHKRTNANSGQVDTKTWTGTVGYDMSVVDAGATSVNFRYTQTDDSLLVNDDHSFYGVNVAQSLSDYGTTIYGGVSQGEYSSTGVSYEDVTSGWVGVKVAF